MQDGGVGSKQINVCTQTEKIVLRYPYAVALPNAENDVITRIRICTALFL